MPMVWSSVTVPIIFVVVCCVIEINYVFEIEVIWEIENSIVRGTVSDLCVVMFLIFSIIASDRILSLLIVTTSITIPQS